jgi:hypothetical protein
MKKVKINFHQTELSTKSIKYFARFIIQYGTYRDRVEIGGQTISSEHVSIDMGNHVFESRAIVGNIKTPAELWYKKLKKDVRIDRVEIEVTDKEYDIIRKDLINYVGKGRYSLLLAIFSEIEEWGIIPRLIKNKIYKYVGKKNLLHYCSKFVQMALNKASIVPKIEFFTPNELLKCLISKDYDLIYGYINEME